MSDLVERLKAPMPRHLFFPIADALCMEASAEITRLQKELETAREALEPFVAMIERSDALDTAWLAANAPGMDIEAYTPSTDKIVSSGEMRDPVYVTRGQFRHAAKVYRATKGGRE